MVRDGQEDRAKNTAVSKRQTAGGRECMRGVKRPMVTRAWLARLPSRRVELVSIAMSYGVDYLTTFVRI